ncbi:DEAD/DEAH box helicase [Aureibaculum sp. A20]|uniref:DEAD/DEAH box helicase n=1 Tax=Aureibaculum flavum TaxID=2795986 RepID=A0ABS0WU69_9FLAO|nr:DEAD/DEAH box helicase [Aureibaculum flavum]MBJ2175493.1 DEAD/DEAH box helicase [Aureibaculum flavum]
MTFKDLGIVEPILKALNEKGYTNPTPIQEQAIPILLKGKDLMGCAQTGTGKTAAFAIPIIQHIYNNNQNGRDSKKIKALVVTPTRELAIQIFDNFKIYGKNTGIKCNVIFGGVKQHAQTAALRQGVDVLVATPGRLLDLMNQGFISLRDIEYFVLDEADQMLDMGFIHDIKKILAKLPQKRQSLFFSATMPKSIVELSRKILGNFDTVTIKPEQATAEKVEQAIYFVHKKAKIKLLIHLLETQSINSTLVFSRTKHGANKIVKLLEKSGINAAAIHGNKSQGARVKALEGFKDGKIKVLVATDIAARGIDIDELALVVNYDLPNIAETYVHRIGRTGRAKASGIAVSFCDQEERAYLRDIEKLIKQKIPVISEHPFINFKDDNPGSDEKPRRQSRSNNSSNRDSRNGNKIKKNPNKKRRESNSNSRNR